MAAGAYPQGQTGGVAGAPGIGARMQSRSIIYFRK